MTHETSSKPCPASQFVVDVLDGLIPVGGSPRYPTSRNSPDLTDAAIKI
jgi:hypothetical protein